MGEKRRMTRRKKRRGRKGVGACVQLHFVKSEENLRKTGNPRIRETLDAICAFNIPNPSTTDIVAISGRERHIKLG